MNHHPKRRTLPPEIAAKLRAMRATLRRWVLVKEIGRWLLIVLAIVAGDLLLDRFFRMDFAQRAIMLVVMLGAAMSLFLWRVVRPLLKRTTDDALLYEVEAHYPDLNESLIGGAQLARTKEESSSRYSESLTESTIQRSIAIAEKTDFSAALDQQKFARNQLVLGLGLLLTALLTLGIWQTDLLGTWFNRNILLGSRQWPQATYLQFVGAEDGQLVLPRGADHRLLVHVSRESRVQDVSVELDINGPAGWTTHSMKPTGKHDGREYLFVLHNVASELTLRARGGDDETEPVSVVLVEPPTVLDLKMSATYPDYTGIGSSELTGPGPHSLPAGSRVTTQASVNKSLRTFQAISESGAFDLVETDTPLTYRLDLPRDDEPLAGGKYELQLVDDMGLENVRPGNFVIQVRDDGPPKVLASLLGISGRVVPRARVPVSCNVSDEFGLNRIEFHCNWKNVEPGQEQPPNSRDLLVADLAQSDRIVRQFQDVAVIDLDPLALTVGTSFRFVVKATDNLPREIGSGPNVAESAEFLLRVVSEEELRADLLRREIEQRRAFSRAYDAQQDLMTELLAIAAREVGSRSPEKFAAQRQSDLIALLRDQKLIGTSVDAIAGRFEEYLVEAQNNRLDENQLEGVQSITDRFANQIIGPIRALDTELISLASRNLDNCRRKLGDREQFSEAVNQTTAVHEQILLEMKQIMDAMTDSEEFQEVVNRLLEIKRGENRIREEIEKRRTDETEIFDEEDVFDDS